MQTVLYLAGAGAILLWGVAHIVPTRNVVKGFGELSPDNNRIITMEWIAEGLTLCFLGVLVVAAVLVLGAQTAGTRLVAVACAGMLLVMAGLSAVTGARTAVLPMKLCPLVKSVVAALYLLGAFV